MLTMKQYWDWGRGLQIFHLSSYSSTSFGRRIGGEETAEQTVSCSTPSYTAATMASTTAAAGTTCLVVSTPTQLSLSSQQARNTSNLVSAFHGQGLSLRLRRVSSSRRRGRWSSSGARAAKLPQGVEAPKEEPRLPPSFWGFTENAEVWNARASMIGLIGIILLEFIAKRGLLEMIGFDVGKGLDLPL
ncbi:hypothetical protein R1flu_004856 [Riccia fluitans]|uniref:One helix protein n=1 Tax=Riccia fluitans TaxID=41844 RepID=A0ABD1YRG9_9MARC